MKNYCAVTTPVGGTSFDLFKISLAREHVGLSPNTLRKFSKERGLPLYKTGKLLFASKSELAALITSNRLPITSSDIRA